jgi:hypothetical protein
MKEPLAPDARRKGQPGWFSTMALKEALARGGCPLCHAGRTSVLRHLFSFLYEGMTSGIAREEFLKGGWFGGGTCKGDKDGPE